MDNRKYIVWMKCEGAEGYFTGVKLTSTSREVCVHPYRARAKVFDSKFDAMSMAASLKKTYRCVISWRIIEA